jgi:hypothetical protein
MASDEDAFTAGPGGTPEPWRVVAGTASYDGAILIPSAVAGGPKGTGTINTNALYLQGININTIFLPFIGGTITGPLNVTSTLSLTSTALFKLADSVTRGQVLTADGIGGTLWSDPGGPYLPLAGGTLTGALNLSGISLLSIGGGTTSQVLSTNGAGVLSWANPSTVISLPTGSPVGWLLATDGGSNPYWTNVLPGGPYAVAVTGGYTPLSGGTMTGLLLLSGAPTSGLHAATKTYVDNSAALGVLIVGSTMTGLLVLSANPTAALGAATKQYVDTQTNTSIDMGTF